MAATKTLSLLGFLLITLIALQSLNVSATLHYCVDSRNFGWYTYPLVPPETSCAGSLTRWRYSPTDDVHGDCIPWCMNQQDVGIKCAQMDSDENGKVYCGCYPDCDPRDDDSLPGGY
ncbi:hypothetical protein MKW94_009405 [Papaver nudicaule]|uniref:Uncharacterized protein n=1 Tax=Papaver nudicaule TaxID=74823 RepID=A0AA41VDS5_PAPNU|nr:hypothetical protein [Papaver nudicaule]